MLWNSLLSTATGILWGSAKKGIVRCTASLKPIFILWFCRLINPGYPGIRALHPLPSKDQLVSRLLINSVKWRYVSSKQGELKLLIFHRKFTYYSHSLTCDADTLTWLPSQCTWQGFSEKRKGCGYGFEARYEVVGTTYLSVRTFFISHSHITQLHIHVQVEYLWQRESRVSILRLGTKKCYSTLDTTVHKTHTVQSTLQAVCASETL